MRNLKKSLSIILTLALLVSSVFVGGMVTASAADELYTTINTYDDYSDITLTNTTFDGSSGITANDSWVYENFGAYGVSVQQDPLNAEPDNAILFTQARGATDSWPTSMRIYKQGTDSAKTTFALFVPKAETTYEFEFKYYVEAAPSQTVNFQIRNTPKRLHGGSEPNCYNAERILTSAVTIEAGATTDGWVTAKGTFTTKETVYGLGLYLASTSSARSNNHAIYVDDLRISECRPVTVYNFDGANSKVVYASNYTILAELEIPERDGYILTGVYGDAELTNKLNAGDKAINYTGTGVYYGWAKLNPGEYYAGFENYAPLVGCVSYDSETTSITSGNTYAGGYNLKIDALANSLNSFELRDKSTFEVKAGTKYVISFQYRSSAAAELYAGVALSGNVPNSATAVKGADLSAAGEWTSASIEVTLNKGHKEGYVPALMVRTAEDAIVEFDHIYMTYPVETTQNITNGFVTSKDWYPVLGEAEEEESNASEPWNGEVEAPTDADGDGVYEIDTAEKLAYIVKNGGTIYRTETTTDPETGEEASVEVAVVENGSYILTKDIYINDITKYNWLSDAQAGSGIRGWYTNDSVKVGFNGTIDGNYHSIYGLYSKYIHSCWNSNTGGRALIPALLGGQTATIKNLNMDYAHVDAETNAALFIGNVYSGTAIIDSCTAGENVFITGYHACVFVSGGYSGAKYTVSNCASYAKTEIENLASGESLTSACHGIASSYYISKAVIENSFNANGPIINSGSGAVTTRYCYETEAGGEPATLLTQGQMQGKTVLTLNGTMPLLNTNGNVWTATSGYPVISASVGLEVTNLNVWDGTRVQPTKTDSDGYILISTAEELSWVVYSGKLENKNYRLTNNIYLNSPELVDWETGVPAAGYEPLPWYTDVVTTATADDATTAAIESTVIDGNGYTVYGMYYEDNSTIENKTNDLATTRYHNIGLFSRIASNVNITVNKLGVDYTYINHYAAASPFFGDVGENGGKNYITIDQCYVGENVKVHGGSAGAFIGYVCGGSCRLTISNSYVLGEILNGSKPAAASKFTGNVWGLSYYNTVTNPETSESELEVYGYYNNYTVAAVIETGWNEGIRVHSSYANNYGAGYTGFESDGVTPYYWWHTNRTKGNMKGLDALTNDAKMPNLNKDAEGNNTGLFTATESYPVLTAFIGNFYTKPEVPVDDETEEDTTGGYINKIPSSYPIWDGTAVAPTEGDGTEGNPWKIYTGAELYYVIKNNGGAGVYYQLQNDIYLNDLSKINWLTGSVAYEHKVNTWTYGNPTAFQGNLDGNGFAVYGVYIHNGAISMGDASATYSAGLISNIRSGSATVKNLGVDYSYIHYSGPAGAIVGSVSQTGVSAVVSNCYSGSHVKVEGNFAGGIVGMVSYKADLTIDKCYSLASFKSNTGHALIANIHYNHPAGNVVISNSYSSDKLIRNTNAASLTVTNCYAAVKGSSVAGVTVLSDANIKGADAVTNESKMIGLKNYFKDVPEVDFDTANYNTYVYLPAGTTFDEDFAPLFFDTRMAPLDAEDVMFTNRMVRGAYVRFTKEVDVTKINVPVSTAHRVAFGTAQALLESGYYDLETEMITENLADQPDTAVNYIFITDPHFDTIGSGGSNTRENSVKQFALAIKMANENDEIDFICLGGDLMNGDRGTTDIWSEAVSTYLDPIKDCTKPVFVLVGNHDDNCYGTVADSATIEQLNARIMTNDKWQAAIIDKYVNRTLADGTVIKVTQDEDPYKDVVNSKYYYYDLEGKNTRIICLNASDYEYAYDENGEFTLIHNTSTSANVRSNTYNGYTFWGYSKYQMEWLAEEALGTLPEDYNVVVLSHMAITSSSNGKENYHNGNVLSDIMAAYQNKTTYNHDEYGISADFGTDTGRIMAYQHGHEHIVYEKYNADPEVWQFSSSTTNPHSSGITGRIMNENGATIDVMSATVGYVYKQALGQGDSGMFINPYVAPEGDVNLDTQVDICDLVALKNMNANGLVTAVMPTADFAKMRDIILGK